jgi:protein-S-isoprenylcysteine O-methyltransferase Ste14
LTGLLAGVALVACWGTVLVVWLAGAIYNAAHAPRKRIRGESRPVMLIGASFLVCAIVLVFGRGFAQDFVVDASWVRLLGLVVLVASTLFALWARFSLGTSWSVGAQVGGDRRLRTRGPYAVTRHPIYTGLLGMLVGTALVGGLGQWIVLVAAGLVVAEVKIHMEEQLLLAIFPEEYPRYRRQVPQLVPGLGVLHRRG